MNLLGCNMMRQNIASGLTHDNSQKMYLHQAATPSLLQNNPFSKKHFENPNTFLLNAPGLGTPCSPKQSSISKDHVSEKNLLNSSIISSVNTQSINSDTMLFDKSSVETALNNMNTPESPRKEPEMETSDEEMSCSDESEESPMEVSFEDDDDSFIVFEAEPDLSKSKEIPIDEFIDEDNSFIVLEAEAGPSKSKEIPIEEFIDEDDSFIVFETETGSSNGRESPIIEFIDEDDSDVENGVDEDAESDTESLDDFVVFADHEPEEIPAVKEQKPNNGKKVTFAKESELCTVHKMVKWSFAYRKARKGLWEQFARDTERFKYRAYQFGASLNQFLLPEHRRKVYEERFKNRQD